MLLQHLALCTSALSRRPQLLSNNLNMNRDPGAFSSCYCARRQYLLLRRQRDGHTAAHDAGLCSIDVESILSLSHSATGALASISHQAAELGCCTQMLRVFWLELLCSLLSSWTSSMLDGSNHTVTPFLLGKNALDITCQDPCSITGIVWKAAEQRGCTSIWRQTHPAAAAALDVQRMHPPQCSLHIPLHTVWR